MTTTDELGFNDPTAQRLERITTGAGPEIVGPMLADILHDPRWLDCDVALVSGGKSNLTYRVACDAGEVILRRPPLGHILPTAHDMGREYRVMTALADTAVPVPRTFHLGDGDSPLGASFYVMERVVGHICRNALPPGYAEEPEGCRKIGEALVDVLADLHTVDPSSAGLAEFGRPAGFMERQLRRWSQQWEASKTVDLPALDALRDHLVAAVPEQRANAVVHGDYRLDNTILHPTEVGAIVAVLDWEMSTLGDPLADLGAMLAYWSQADDSEVLRRARIMAPVTACEGFPTRAEIIERYARRTGIDVTSVPFYETFGLFKTAVVIEQIYVRFVRGQTKDERFAMMGESVRRLAEIASASRRD